MARSGYSISRYSSRRRRLAIVQREAQECLPLQADFDGLFSPPDDSPCASLMTQKANSESPQTWLFVTACHADDLASPISVIEPAGIEIRETPKRQHDVLIDAAIDEINLSDTSRLLHRFKPDFVTICLQDLLSCATNRRELLEFEKTLIAIVLWTIRIDAIPIVVTPCLTETGDEVEADSQLMLELIRAVTAEHNAYMMDWSRVEVGADSELRSPSASKVATIRNLFRQLLDHCNSGSRMQSIKVES